MANDEEVEDLGGLESTNIFAEGARAGTEEQPAPPTGYNEEDPVAAAVLHEDTSVASAPAAEEAAASAGPLQVAG